MALENNLIKDLGRLYEEAGIECPNVKRESCFQMSKENRRDYLDNSALQERNLDALLDIFYNVPKLWKDKQKIIVTKGVAEEAAGIIIPGVEVTDFLDSSPFREAAKYYGTLMKYRRNHLKMIEDDLAEKHKGDPKLDKILRNARRDFHETFGTRKYNLCKKAEDGKFVDENLVLNFLFDAASNSADFFLHSNDTDIFDQFIQIHTQFSPDKTAHDFAKRFHENPKAYKKIPIKEVNGFAVEIPKEEFASYLKNEPSNVVSLLSPEHGGNFRYHYRGTVSHNCNDFLKVKNSTGKNTDLFGDMNCYLMLGGEKGRKEKTEVVMFYEDQKTKNGIYYGDVKHLIFDDWLIEKNIKNLTNKMLLEKQISYFNDFLSLIEKEEEKPDSSIC